MHRAPRDRQLPMLQAKVADGEDVAALGPDFQDVHDDHESPPFHPWDDVNRELSPLLQSISQVWSKCLHELRVPKHCKSHLEVPSFAA